MLVSGSRSIMTTTDKSRFRVDARCELLPFLLHLPLRLSRKRAKDLLRFDAVAVEGKVRVRHDTELEPGDMVVISFPVKSRPTLQMLDGLSIVHLDDSIVVADKPAGMLSMGSEPE